MKKKILYLIILLSNITFAQSWQWAKQIGGPGMDRAFIGFVDSQSNVYVFGMYAKPYASTNYNNCYLDTDTLYGRDDSFLAKYDGSGNLLWLKNCVSNSGSMVIRGFAFDSANSVLYVTGIYDFACNIDTCLLSTTLHSAFLAKLDENGNCIWAENIGANPVSSTAGTALAVDNNGYIYMAGVTDVTIQIDTSSVPPGSFLAKFDSDGNNLWSKTKFSYTGFQPQMIFTTLKYFNNNIYAAGQAAKLTYSDTLKVDTVLVTTFYLNGYGLLCMDAENSTARWLRVDGYPHNFNGYSKSIFDIDTNGNIYVAGSFYDTSYVEEDTLVANSTYNSWLAKYDSSGNFIFVKQFYSTSAIKSFGVSVPDENTVLLIGSVQGQGTLGSVNVTASAGEDLLISRFDSAGNCSSADHAGVGVGVSMTALNNNIYITGIFPPTPVPSGSISIDGNTFTNYGWEDIVFAKHDMLINTETLGRPTNNSLVIYANPNKGSFRLIVPDDFQHEKNLQLNIFDGHGKLIKQQTLNLAEQRPKMDIFNQASGTYVVTLSNGRKTYSGSMVVE
jgi:hypothetical protein